MAGYQTIVLLNGHSSESAASRRNGGLDSPDLSYLHVVYSESNRQQLRTTGYHLIMVMEGLAMVEDPSFTSPIREGTYNLIYVDIEHQPSITFAPQSEVIWLKYPEAFVHQNLRGLAWPATGGLSESPGAGISLLFKEAHSFSADILRIIRDLTHCPLDGYYLELFIRAKSTEILAYLLHYHDHPAGPTLPSPSPRMAAIRDRMQQVRAVLHERLDNPPSLHELAQLVGTNESYLKLHFKQLFGTTVYGYLHDLRMETAQRLLQENSRSIADIARRLGYRHASHFSTVFKKHFGVSPREMNR